MTMNHPDTQPATTPPARRFILWQLVWSLAAVQGAITLSWVIYKLYLPQLLAQFGFSAGFAVSLLFIENILAIALEPVMGGLSDRTKRWMGTRFPLISLGVILAATLFILIPCFAIFVSPATALGYLLPALMVQWAIAMAVFRSPVLALLGQAASVSELPQAVSVLTFVGGAFAAFAPLSRDWLLSLGPAVTFGAGSIVLLIAVGILRTLHPPTSETASNLPLSEHPNQQQNGRTLLSSLGLIFATGLFVTWGMRFLMNTLSLVFKAGLPNIDVKIPLFWVAIGIALAALPAGKFASEVGNRWGILIGILGTLLLLLLIGVLPTPGLIIFATLGLVIFVSLINNGTIPFAIELMPASRSGLGVGMFFSGIAAAFSVFDLIFGAIDGLTLFTSTLYTIILFIFAGLWVSLSLVAKREPSL
jgi:Na+/melibiose symporter-like transporter